MLNSWSILTVVTPAATSDLTVIDTVKLELGISDNKHNARLANWITQSSAAIAKYCNRVFGKETLQEEYWPHRSYSSWKVSSGIDVLQLARWPIVSVTSITEDGVTLVDGTDYRTVYVQGQLIRLDSNLYPCSWRHALPVVVNYVAGYDLLQGLPYDIERACISMVKQLYFSAGRDPLLISDSVTGIGDSRWSVTQASGALSPDVADLVDKYRVPVSV